MTLYIFSLQLKNTGKFYHLINLMLKHPYNTFGATPDETITLLDGRTIPMIYVSFIPSTYQFIYNYQNQKLDVTSLMTQAQKLRFPGFDQTEWNNRLYLKKKAAEGNPQPARLETSVSRLFTQNVAADLEKKTNLGIGSLGATLGLVIGGYLVYQLIINSPKSKR